MGRLLDSPLLRCLQQGPDWDPGCPLDDHVASKSPGPAPVIRAAGCARSGRHQMDRKRFSFPAACGALVSSTGSPGLPQRPKRLEKTTA